MYVRRGFYQLPDFFADDIRYSSQVWLGRQLRELFAAPRIQYWAQIL